MKQIIIFISIALLAFTGCKKDGERHEAGYFILTEIQNSNLKSISTIYDEDPKTEFSLGDVKASREFYFFISNGGENPIFNVTLSTNNTHFPIAPENISILPGSNLEGANNIIPLISLGVLHGIQLNGVGMTDLLPMGENSAELTITGKTIEKGDTIDLESKFVFNVNAKVMDIEVYSNGQEINLNSRAGSAMMGNYGVNGLIPYYNVSSNTIEIKNVGNVDITLNETTLDDNGKRKDIKTDTLIQNQTVSINLSQSYTILELKSDGTITNSSRIKLSDNGNGYLAFFK